MTAPAATTNDVANRRWVKELQAGERIEDQVFLVHKKDLRTTNNGALYIHLVLADRTGQLLTRIWQATQPQYEAIPLGGFIRARGRLESYKGSLQFILDGLRPVSQGDVDLAHFIPSTEHDVEEMWQRVLAILRTIKNRHLLLLVKHFVEDREIVAGFKKAPAAVSLHHAYIGGLLEHTLNVLELATLIFGQTDDTTSRYPHVSRDLVLAGIFLHDIGKSAELSCDPNIDYTDAGRLVGHIVQAAVWIDRKAADVEQETGERFPEDVQNVLTHIVLAHHGTHEFGSPKIPSIPEAIAVHHLDNLDAKLHMFLHQIHADSDPEGRWTQFVPSLGTKVFKPDVMGARPANE
jgi:3'-5' exoribonuclease